MLLATLSFLATLVTAERSTPDKIYGVNLGGWLLLEPWITPSLFQQFPDSAGVVDEWTFCEYLGKDQAINQLEAHWDSFFSKDDLQILKDGGINTLRIPVGYWITGNIADGEPWVEGSFSFLERLLGWAKELGLYAIIDVHAGPGSQNGFDNSGKLGPVKWTDQVRNPVTGEWEYPNIKRSLDVLTDLSNIFNVPGGKWDGTVLGIGILNEPRWDVDIDLLKNEFYLPAYKIFHRNAFGGDFHMSDAFRLGAWWGFMPPPSFENVFLDTHIYHVFDNYLLSLTPAQHADFACTTSFPEIRNAPMWTVVGEWCLAFTDCALYLNGYRNPSLSRWQGELNGSPRYGSCVGLNDSSTFTPEYKAQLKVFAQTQMSAYEQSRGWFFWTAKTEQAPQWDYIQGLKEGWIPKMSERTKFC